jgi:signal transduction histidine kinase
MDRIFEPFFTAKKDIGTGLGLRVMKQIVESNGGQVSIESSTELGRRGTAVRLFLPDMPLVEGEKTHASGAAAAQDAAL